ncbi:exodeoxyribonuclease III [Salinarimonas chemoclinalis]|uniref:exodeoxyribonuclease III n=1 Tax=Salinarimonas chemoclinalis TaxID=3241599 RepID=UPI003558A458
MRITTWNVNSIRQRQGHLLDFLRVEAPDVVCLQELKTTLDNLPRAEIEDAGYNVAAVGQKGFNGVALLSKHPIEDVREALPGDAEDQQARWVEGVISIASGVVRVASIYLPNGNPVDSEKYPYKLAFMDRLIAHARELMRLEEPLVLAGDYNVIPELRDAADPAAWEGDALYLPQTRARFRALMALGLTDALRACDEAPGRYTFWDYQAGAWQRDKGIRIDHLLLSPQAADRLEGVTIHKQERAKEKPSDHVPVTVRLRA